MKLSKIFAALLGTMMMFFGMNEGSYALHVMTAMAEAENVSADAFVQKQMDALNVGEMPEILEQLLIDADEQRIAAPNPVLVNAQALVNGWKSAQIGAVTYSALGEGYTLDPSSAGVRVRNGDRITFKGVISAPEGESISWVRVDVYDASTEVPYIVGAEYYRDDHLNVQKFDLANIPALTIGDVFGKKEYALVEGGKYIIMFSVGDSMGNGFADMDAEVEDIQGPSIAVNVMLSPANCKHPHSDYEYILHSSGEIRKQSYDDLLTHKIEPLYERYCGLCGTFLMNIWGEGVAEEHSLGSNGVCLDCGYYAGISEDEMADAAAGEEENSQGGDVEIGSAETLKMLFENIIKMTNPDRRVNVRTSWENEKLAVGDILTLTAELTGYDGLSYTIFWQCDKGDGFEDIDIADGHASIQFVVDEENKLWRWRAGVNIDVNIPDVQEGSPIIQETATTGETGSDAMNTEGAAE